MNAEGKGLTPTQGRTALLGVAALFFVPLFFAFYLYYAGGWRPAGRTNHGELVSPARPLPAAQFATPDGKPVDAALFRGKWTLVYLGDGRCEADCQRALWVMRQTRVLLAKDMDRVQRVFIIEQQCCNLTFLQSEHPGLALLTPQDATAMLALFPRTDAAHSVYVIDPLGNLMMRFDARQNPKGLLSDLEKLLKLSHIG